MTTGHHRSIAQIVDEQSRRWELARGERPAERPHRPVVTVSRQYGSLGGEVARRVADQLKLDLFDRELIHEIAESTHLSERVVSALDEKDRELLTDWMTSLATNAYLSPAGYIYHLTRVVGAIAHHGGAVIVGRGAHLILDPGKSLRVLVVAPLETRVQTVMQREGLSEREARRRATQVEADRKAFLMKHFHVESDDPTRFDLVVNTGLLGVEGATEAVSAAVARLPVKGAGS
jgi:cytidylate kinase